MRENDGMSSKAIVKFRDTEMGRTKSRDEFSNAIIFLWRNRKAVIVIIILAVIMTMVIGNIFLSNHQRSQAESEPVKSANLDRVEDWVYRLRVETFGDRSDEIRENTLLDFDRELNITIQEERGLLTLKIENLTEGVVINRIAIIGRLSNRSFSDFHFIFMSSDGMNLYYNETSNAVPVIAFMTNEEGNRNYNATSFLTSDEFNEFVDNFILDTMTIDVTVDNEEIRIKYSVRYDSYVVLED